ncbi:hypothetical protein [Flavonifractor plautii]|uniref:hypothetical protein n=1 Tax=Flavonifractor plautii TaxID=292800 RepID=UPI001FABF95E|nr:hypothetical protein [Flavonifractor plautii]
MKNLLVRLGPKAPRYYVQIMAFILIVTYMITPALAVEDMWTAANRIIVDVYNKIAGISTVLAGLMSAVAVIGAKVSNNQHKTDQAWDWLKRIWIAWAIINGMGAFLAYRKPPAGGHLRQIRRRRVLHALRRNGMSLPLLHTALRPGFPCGGHGHSGNQAV